MTPRYQTYREEHAVSPVVAVMLMLVVTIIIAAVVSGFSGGMIGNVDQKAPSLTMDVKIVNTGNWDGSGFFATVTSVSGPISTKDIKIVTSWTAASSTGGNTTLPEKTNVKVLGDPDLSLVSRIAPFGTGPGINGSSTIGSLGTGATTFSSSWQQFGNYSLMAGTTLTAQPCGAAELDDGSSANNGYGVKNMYQYTAEYLDPASAVLGHHWENLRAGDRVNVKVIYTPTGSVIFQKDIPVKEG